MKSRDDRFAELRKAASTGLHDAERATRSPRMAMRTREEILHALQKDIDDRLDGENRIVAAQMQNVQNKYLLEVLLDIRDLLAKKVQLDRGE